MMAKPMKTLELHYPVIQFLIIARMQRILNLLYNLNSLSSKIAYNVRSTCTLLNGSNILIQEMTFFRNYGSVLRFLKDNLAVQLK